MADEPGRPLVELRDISMAFGRASNQSLALNGVTLAIRRGETFGLVGLSGAGKTTVGRLVVNLLQPTSGEIWFDGSRIDALPAPQRRRLAARMQMIFQNPIASMNPRLTAAEIVARPLRAFRIGTAQERQDRIAELLEQVGLTRRHAQSYPHELSGGQCQRLGIARALASRPDFIFLDEPVSALDVSVQAQILNLLRELQESLRLTYLLVANNVSVTRFFCDRVGVLDRGVLVEFGSTEDVFTSPTSTAGQALVKSSL